MENENATVLFIINGPFNGLGSLASVDSWVESRKRLAPSWRDELDDDGDEEEGRGEEEEEEEKENSDNGVKKKGRKKLKKKKQKIVDEEQEDGMEESMEY